MFDKRHVEYSCRYCHRLVCQCKTYHVVHAVKHDDVPREAILTAASVEQMREFILSEYGDDSPEITLLDD